MRRAPPGSLPRQHRNHGVTIWGCGRRSYAVPWPHNLRETIKTMGESSSVSRLLAVTVSGVGALWLAIGPRSVGAGAVDVQWRSRVSPTLQSVYDNDRLVAGSNSKATNVARFDAQGR